MPIIRTAQNQSFLQVSNALLNQPMPFRCQAVLLHLLSKPSNWQVNKSAIAKTLGLSIYIIKKSLAHLRKLGYAIYKHCKTGFGQWFIFDTIQTNTSTITPTSPVNSPKVVIPTLVSAPTLVIQTNKQIQSIKQQPAPSPQPTVQNPVVVPSLIFPSQLTAPQLKASKSIIKKVKQPAVQQQVLFALAYSISNGSVRNPAGYLKTLVVSVENGTFTPIQASGAPNAPNVAVAKTNQILSSYRATAKAPPTSGILAGLRSALQGN